MPLQSMHEDTLPEIILSQSQCRSKKDPALLDENVFIFPLGILDQIAQGELNRAGK